MGWDEAEHPRDGRGRFTEKWAAALSSRLAVWAEEDLESSDRYLQGLFGEPAVRESGPRAIHPGSGYEVKTGRHRRFTQPERGEMPAGWIVDDYGDDFDRLFPDRDVAQEPLTHVYRAMALSEWEQAQQRGYIQSDLRGVIAEWEGTNAGLDAATARSYIPGGGEPAVIVRLRVLSEDEWFAISADAYPRTRRRIPIDRVEAVSDPMRMGIDPGSRYGRRRLERLRP